jgi:hypothetical protein
MSDSSRLLWRKSERGERGDLLRFEIFKFQAERWEMVCKDGRTTERDSEEEAGVVEGEKQY